MRLLPRPLVVASLLVPTSAFAAPIRVAVVTGPGGSSAALAAQLNNDTFFDFTATVATVADVDTTGELAAYDVVVISDSGSNDAGWTAQMGAALKAFVTAGGGVVGAGWIDYAITASTAGGADIDDTLPIDAYPDGNNVFCSGSLAINLSNTNHPVTYGLPTSFTTASADIEISTLPVDSGSTVLGTATGSCTGNPAQAVVVGNTGAGRTVYLGLLYGASSGYNNADLRAGSADRLLEQAVAWASRKAPIRVAVLTGPGGSAAALAAQLNDDTWFNFTASVVTPAGVDTAAELGAYDAVVISDSGSNDGGWTAAMAAALKAFVQTGGGVVGAGWIDYSVTAATLGGADLDEVLPIDAFPDGNNVFCSGGPIPLNLSNTTHPVTTGLPTSFTTTSADIEISSLPVDTGATVLGTSGGSCNGNPAQAVVVNDVLAGRTVYLGLLYGASSGYNNADLRTGNADRLLEQAIAWSTHSTVAVTPLTIGTVTVPATANEGASVAMTAAATGPGTLTYAWNFGDTLTATGASVTHTYVNNGTYTVTLVVTSSTGPTATTTKTITVANVAPTIATMNVPATSNEGAAVAMTATATDPGTADVLTYTWAFGDTGTGTGASVSHTYVNNGTYTVTLTVKDADGGTTSSTKTITVANVAPTIATMTVPATANEGSSVAMTATATDPGTADVLTYAWNYGDTATGTGASATHSYANNGTYTVTLTVSDGTGSSTATRTITVANVAPTIGTVTVPATADEGATLSMSATATDPGTADVLTYAWDFGDTATAGGASTVHAFADEGTYTVTLTVTDGNGGSTTATRTVTVANVSPTIGTVTVPATGNEGANIAVSANATDPGVNDVLTYTWAWGDGSADGVGASATHAYPDNGSNTITLTVTDGDGGTVSSTQTITVANVAPVGTITGPATGNEGDSLAFSATAVDVPADTVAYDWDYGDNVTALNAGAAVTHTYADNGTYTVELTTTDEDGGVSVATWEMIVANVAPTIDSFTVPATARQGATVSVSSSATDAGVLDVLTYTWSWGDGTADDVGASATHAWADEGSPTVTLTVTDEDGGIATETATILIDACDGLYADADNDGVIACLDCDDTRADVYPGAPELPDGVDNDCAGVSPDTDSDGLTDEEEVALGTDKNRADTDGDGLSDGDEIMVNETDPLAWDTDGGGASDGAEALEDDTDPNAATDDVLTDDDCDGLTNSAEKIAGSDPAKADTDGGGTPDVVEVRLDGTDPTVAADDVVGTDTDGDGLSDALETQLLGTDPGVADSDGDGRSDGAEVAECSDPLTANADTDTGLDTDGVVSPGKCGCASDPTPASGLLLFLVPLLARRRRAAKPSARS